jgi:DNA-directed RNA polymerase specialized sigma24 family protein
MRRYWYSDSLPEIAKLAGMSYNSAAVRLHRVKGKLKKLLLKEGVPV